MTTTFSMRRSFMRMKRAARLTGSNSVFACFQSRSYSVLAQRPTFRPVQLLAFWAISQLTVLTRYYFEKEKEPNFRSVWMAEYHDWRFDSCANPRTGVSLAPTRTVRIIG